MTAKRHGDDSLVCARRICRVVTSEARPDGLGDGDGDG